MFALSGFFSSVVVGFLADKMIKGYLQNVLWLKEQSDKASVNTIENTLGRIFDADPEKLMRFPQTLVGHSSTLQFHLGLRSHRDGADNLRTGDVLRHQEPREEGRC